MPSNILTLREVVDMLILENDPIEFHRIPITAETAPDETDFDAVLQLLCRQTLADTAFVLYV